MRKYKTIGSVLMAFSVILGLFSFSFLQPGWLKPVDTIRIGIQKAIMTYIGTTYLDDFNRDAEGNLVAGADRLDNEELAGYFALLQTGDIMCTESISYISSYITPGRWKHSLIFIGNKQQFEQVFSPGDEGYEEIAACYDTGEEYLILDSTASGVTIREFNYVSEKMGVTCLKSLTAYHLNQEAAKTRDLILFAMQYIGMPYDYDLNTGSTDAFYCSELVFDALTSIGIEVNTSTSYVGRTVVTPVDIAEFLTDYIAATHVLLLEKSDYRICNNA